ncbi:hypothetical protein MmTuc01_0521 [Methanosarcina mazei Tuc01]|uniref:Uncharacterized protein n=1 Tax=Methanosarcina mazei Tuc01 TaxID=1236903 RepID=M1Q126_METMZ|nr:hypothetical protein MmTuc01_0521 [Methanosarcina mazei Tuc01]
MKKVLLWKRYSFEKGTHLNSTGARKMEKSLRKNFLNALH